MSDTVFVGLLPNGDQLQPVRIFKNRKAAYASGMMLMERSRGLAVGLIRHQLFVRSHGECELCGSIVNEQGGHMHERKHRGRGGEISLENSVFICVTCHQLQHPEREIKFTRRER